MQETSNAINKVHNIQPNPNVLLTNKGSTLRLSIKIDKNFSEEDSNIFFQKDEEINQMTRLPLSAKNPSKGKDLKADIESLPKRVQKTRKLTYYDKRTPSVVIMAEILGGRE